MSKLPLDFTCDLCDHFESNVAAVNLRVLEANKLRHFGKVRQFRGQVETVQCLRDNSKVKQQLSTAGNGRVLIVDGFEDLSTALMGDNVAQGAVDNGWAGVIVMGAIRDCQTINTMNIGVLALGTNPRRSVRKDMGTVGSPVAVCGTIVSSGDWVYVDDNGIVVTSIPVVDENGVFVELK